MRKRQAAVALLGGVGLLALVSTPAQANDKPPRNLQIIGIQTCRSVDVAGIGAAIHNLLGIEDEHGDCVNGGELEKVKIYHRR
ncbi:hypothetical protein DZF91_24665 [Actinomadura logoneensis]|uniref:Uncharacterized protein n=1 Tax=Actinomadura logoneensis TaxID=2293572 RepID=A0A372JGG8_9ACTN|nr:hypothetical protein [Actinomadura logoneensis]RFU39009.1 hypothetical protein DZF91_24665 [Actinomadura logoneensis]